MNGYFGAFRDPAISRCGPVPSPRPLLSLDGAFGIGSHFQPQFQGNISVCERTFFRSPVHDIHGRPMGRSRKRKSEPYRGHVETKRTRIVSNASSSGVSFSLGDDSADLPWNCSRSRDGLPTWAVGVDYLSLRWTSDTTNWPEMASTSDLECKFNNSMSLEAADTLSEMSNSNSSETSDKKSKRKKEKREQPLYVPPNRRKSGDSSSADGCPPGHSPKSPSTDEVALPTRKNSTLLKTHENLSCCSKVLLSRLSDDSRNVEPSITRDKENSETDKKQQNGDDLLPRSVLLRRKEEQKSYISSPPGPSENEFDEGVVPNTSSPKKKDRHNGRLNGRLSYAERKEHTYEDIRTEVQEFFFDSHCHLDFIYKKYSCGGIDSWLKSEPGIMHEKFIGCIPNFIEPNLFVENLDPGQYDMDWILQQLQSKYVLGASYGCHPHYGDAFDDRILEKLQYLVENRRMSKLLAIGECGLDYMKSDVDSSVQIQVFSAQLALARKKDVPLVIHCRSGPRGPGDAEKMCLSAMEEAGLSRFHNIHRHCFSENWDTAQKWMESYDNVYFGFTSMIANWEQTSPEKYEVLKRLPLRRMLLETDAPYFRPRQYDSAKTNGCERFALPPMAVNVAFVIARAKGIDVNEVIRVTSQNVLQMYCIKKDIDDIVQH